MLPRIHAPKGRFFQGADGRAVFLRGSSIAARTSQTFAELGFDERNAQLLSTMGVNVMRVGVVWANIEPQPKLFDESYIDSIADAIKILAKYGIYSLVDFHQDEFSQAPGYGNGAPEWATMKRGTTTPECGFPENLRAPVKDCRTDINEASTSFWRNEVIAGEKAWDHYAFMLRHIVTRFKPLGACILGYEIMNEPHPGMTWPECFQDPTVYYPVVGCKTFESTQLAVFYKAMIPVIQAADRDTIVFYEPSVYFDYDAPTHLPEFKFKNLAFAVHMYDWVSPGGLMAQGQMIKFYSEKFNVPVIATEFGASNNLAYLNMGYAALDAAMLSALHWTYENNAHWIFSTSGDLVVPDPSEQAIVVDMSKDLSGANVHFDILETVSRPYPSAVSGTPITFAYDPATGVFTFMYASDKVGGITDISIPSATFSGGYTVFVLGGNVVSTPNASVLQISSTADIVNVQVTKTATSPRYYYRAN